MLTLPRQIGFTLIELLMAVFITAIIGVMAGTSLFTARSAVESTELNIEQLNRFNSFLLRFGRDMEHVVPRTLTIAGASNAAMFFQSGDSDEGFVFTHAGWINPASDLFARSRLQRSAYIFRDATLYRKTWTNLDSEDDEDGKEQLLLENVEAFSLRFMPAIDVSSQPAQKLKWVDKWPENPQQSVSASQGQQGARVALPAAVEMKITVEPWGEITRLYEIAHAK